MNMILRQPQIDAEPLRHVQTRSDGVTASAVHDGFGVGDNHQFVLCRSDWPCYEQIA
jgi:hypothetical protein